MRNPFKKWYALQHICSPYWQPARVTTIFGYPLCTFFFRAYGPFDSQEDCELWCIKENGCAY